MQAPAGQGRLVFKNKTFLCATLSSNSVSLVGSDNIINSIDTILYKGYTIENIEKIPLKYIYIVYLYKHYIQSHFTCIIERYENYKN